MKKHLNESESHMEKLGNKDSKNSGRAPDRLPIQVTLVVRHRVPYLQFFLAVQNSSIGLIVPCLLCLLPLTIRVFTTLQSNLRDL